MILAGMICFILLMKMKDHESTDRSNSSEEICRDHYEAHVQHKHSEKLFNDDHQPKTTSKPFEEGVGDMK